MSTSHWNSVVLNDETMQTRLSTTHWSSSSVSRRSSSHKFNPYEPQSAGHISACDRRFVVVLFFVGPAHSMILLNAHPAHKTLSWLSIVLVSYFHFAKGASSKSKDTNRHKQRREHRPKSTPQASWTYKCLCGWCDRRYPRIIRQNECSIKNCNKNLPN